MCTLNKQKAFTVVIVLSAALLFIIIILYNQESIKSLKILQNVPNITYHRWISTPVILPNSSTTGIDMKTFSVLLAKYASKEKWILLSLVDQGCRDMGLNFYSSFVKKLGITNYLFIGADTKTCTEFTDKNINCFLYKVDKDARVSSVYNSGDFVRKMHIRTYMILDALNLGYSVLHSDVDMIGTKNPFKDFDYMSDRYDIAPLWDCGAHNAGFLFIRNTNASKEVYKQAKYIADTQPRVMDQSALNRGIGVASRSHGLKLVTLPRNKYLCGKAFFQNVGRNFAWDKPCNTCVVVHHNWIVSMEAKIYRMKEMHMWVYDGTNTYYNNPKLKYIYFENPIKFSDPVKTQKEEINSLMNALVIGEILNRTVIYPKFHCGKNYFPCTVLDHLIFRQLLSVYPNYRESTFLQNPKVPKIISESKSKFYYISSGNNTENNLKLNNTLNNTLHNNTISILQPKDRQKGATDSEIKTWFGDNKESVLRFYSLYNAFCCLSDSKQNEEYLKKRKKAVRIGGYMQF